MAQACKQVDCCGLCAFSAHHHRSLDTAFKQQRLKAWQPILTPKTVLPTLFLIGFVFAPIGGLLIWGSSLVSEISFDYTQCENLQGSSSNASLNWFPLPSNKYSYRLKAGSDSIVPPSPRYAYIPDTGLSDPSNQRQCIVEFNIPINLQAPVFFYYGLTNFYQNHRRYVKSLNSDQLQGKYVSPNSLNNSDCDPLGAAGLFGNISIYPCGLIANSIFNGLFSHTLSFSGSTALNLENRYILYTYTAEFK